MKQGITSITIGERVKRVEDTAFLSFKNLQSIEFNAIECTYMVNIHHHGGAFENCNYVTRLVIGPRVKMIPDGAFSAMFSVTEFTWGDSVEYIGKYAYDGAFPSSRSVGNLDLSNCRYMDEYAWGTTHFDTVTIGRSLTYMRNRALYGQVAYLRINALAMDSTFEGLQINTLYIGDEVTKINPSMFKDCNIRILNLSNNNNLRNLGTNAFAGNPNMAGNIVLYNIVHLGDRAFYRCGRLSSVELGNSLGSIGRNTFYGCDHLTTVTLGRGITTIAEDAFTGCTEIRRITSRAFNPPVIDRGTFADVDDDITLNVPCVAVEAYQMAPYWSHFDNIEGQFDWFFSVTSDNISQGSVTVIQTPTCANRQAQFQANPYYGYVFDHWSDGNRQNPRHMVVDSDTLITAIFALDPNIPQDTVTEDIHSLLPNGIKVFSLGSQVIVEGADGLPVSLYDMQGRRLAIHREATATIRFEAPATGIYLLRIGSYPVRRVAVLR